MPPRWFRPRRAALWSLLMLPLPALSGCAGAAAPAPLSLPSHRPSAEATSATPTRARSTAVTLTPPAVASATWSPTGSRIADVPVTEVTMVDSGRISLLWINALALRFRFVPGTEVPENSPSTAADNRPTWVPHLAAAFNGGFWLKDHSGGYYYDRTTVTSMRPGYASLVITTDGRISVQPWKAGTAIGPHVAVVRQNLSPMIVDSRVQSNGSPAHPTWGVPTKGQYVTNRSALGELADGTLVYEFGYHVTPAEMATAMTLTHARTAMSLDINGSWPMAFTYTHNAGVSGVRIAYREYHDPSVYYTRYRKDFIAALLP